MSQPSDFQNEVRKEWLIRVSHYDEQRIRFYSYGLILHNRKGVRRCVSVGSSTENDKNWLLPDYTNNFIGKPSQYILKYLQNRYKFKDLKFEVIYCKEI